MQSDRNKHSPNILGSYRAIHETVIERFKSSGFVLSEDLTFEAMEGFILLEGTIRCIGGIHISVNKRIEVLGGNGANAMVQRVDYSYNVSLAQRGNIFRYDSPHLDHNKQEHVHRYNILDGDVQGQVSFIADVNSTPTLGEVIKEAEAWYYQHEAEINR
jgi:hypothetical protein